MRLMPSWSAERSMLFGLVAEPCLASIARPGGSFADLFQEVGWHLVGGLSLKTWILSLGSGA